MSDLSELSGKNRVAVITATIAAIASIIAAIVSGVLSYLTSENRIRVNQIISNQQAETDRIIAQIQENTQTTIARIESDTSRLIANAEISVSRIEMFNRLIEKMGSPDTSNYALLALWKMYPEESDRRLVVLTAIQNPNENTLNTLEGLGFQKELEPFYDELEQARASGNEEVARAAGDILNRVAPDRIISALIELIADDPFASASHSNVIDLIDVIRDNPSLVGPVEVAADEREESRGIFAYILHQSERPEALIDLLSDARVDPDALAQVSDLLYWGNVITYDEELSPIAVQLAVIILNRRPLLNNELATSAFRVLSRDDIFEYRDSISDERELYLVGLAEEYFEDQSLSHDVRIEAFATLVRWSPTRATQSAVTILACGEGPDLHSRLSTAIEQGLEKLEVKSGRPEVNDEAQEWQRWTEETQRMDWRKNCEM